jgi:hypothetical protein
MLGVSVGKGGIWWFQVKMAKLCHSLPPPDLPAIFLKKGSTMNREQAAALVSQLGIELGGAAKTYVMDDHGEAHFVFKGDVGVMIKHEESVLVVACTLASDIRDDDPSVFAGLLGYQFLGLRTLGAVLSWNASANSLVLSRLLFDEPSAADLARELAVLLRVADRVREEIQPILDGSFSAGDDEPASPGASDFALERFARA